MAINKVIFCDRTLIDISDSTVAPETLAKDEIAYGANGEKIIGTMEASSGGDENAIKTVIESGKELTELTIPKSVTRIGRCMFYQYSDLKSIFLPEGIKTIGIEAFTNCSKLALTSLPDGITSIGNSAFSNCSKLALTSLPANLKTINIWAFKECIGLTAITFKGVPTNVSSSAFIGCTNLTTINVPWSEGAVANAPWGAINATINYNYTG